MGFTSGVTIAPDGNLWVADTAHSRFAIIDPDGTFIEYWGTEGRGPGEFVLRRSNGDGFAKVAFASDGTFYVLDLGNRRIQRFAADRAYMGEWGGFGNEPGRFVDPLWIAVDADDHVLVVDDVRNVVERFTPDGTVLATFEAVPAEVGSAAGVAVDHAGVIHVTSCCPGASVRRYDRDGTWLGSTEVGAGAGPEDQPTGLAIDLQGRLFVGRTPDTPADRIRVYAPDGTLVTQFGGTGDSPEDVGFPFALALDGQGSLYATDYLDGSVKKYRLGAELTAAEPAASGPEGGWSMFRGDAARRGSGIGGPVGHPSLRWRFQAQGAVLHQVAVVGELAYASSDDGVLHALDITTGDERWTYSAAEPPISGPVLADGAVHIFGGDGVLHAIDAATGVGRWRSTTPIAGPSNASATNGAIFVGTADGALVAIDAATGDEMWRLEVSRTGGQVASAAVASGIVYAGSAGGRFVAVDAADGSVVWEFDTGAAIAGTTVVADGIVYLFGTADDGTGVLVALDETTGAERWRIDRPVFTPAVANGVAYAGSERIGVFALDPGTGRELWTFPVSGPARPLAVADDVVYVPADLEHRIYALDAATGAELWRYDVDSGIDCCIAVGMGAVYVGTFLGGVYAIEGDPSGA
jgi:outer membrane protein assembly factor BamB